MEQKDNNLISPPNEDVRSDERIDNKAPGYGPILSAVLVVGLYFLSQIIALILYVLGMSILGYDIKNLFDEGSTLTDSTISQFSLIILVELVTLYFVWIFLKFKKMSRKSIGLGRLPKGSDVVKAVLVFVTYFIVLALVTGLIKQFTPAINTEQEQQIGFKDATQIWQLILVFIGLVIAVPITEEVLVRGFLYTGMRRKLKIIPAAIFTSVIFGIAHLQLESGATPLWIAAIDTALLSMFLIYLREKTGSLWAGIIVHAIKNGLAFIVLFIIV